MTGSVPRPGTAVFWSVFGRIGRFSLGLASSVIVVRALGDHDYGVLSLLRTVLAFTVVIAGAGLGQSVLKFLPVLRVAGDRQGVVVLLRRVVVVQAAVWAGLLTLGYLVAPGFERLFDIGGVGELLVIAIALSVFELFLTVLTHILNASYDTKLLSAANVASHIIFIGLLLVVLPRGWGVLGVLAAGACGQLVTCVIVLTTAGKAIRGVEHGQGREGCGIDRRRLLRFSLPFGLIGLLNMIVWRQSEVFFLAHFRGVSETGFFDLAYRLPQTVLEFIPGTVWPIVMAGFSEAYARDPENLKVLIRKYYKMLFLLSMPVCFLGIALGGRMVPILFGEAMLPAAVPTQVFFAIFTVSLFSTPLSMALYVMEKTHVNLLVYCVLAVVNVGLDLLLIPRYGITGAMIPVALVILLSPFIYKKTVSRFVSGVDIPFGFIGKCVLASSPILLMIPLAGLIGGVVELCGAVAIGMVVVVWGTKKVGLIGREELELLSSVPMASRLARFMSTEASAGGTHA